MFTVPEAFESADVGHAGNEDAAPAGAVLSTTVESMEAPSVALRARAVSDLIGLIGPR